MQYNIIGLILINGMIETLAMLNLDMKGSNYLAITEDSSTKKQQQTNDAFTEKWNKFNNAKSKDKLFHYQKQWYLKLYGFETEESFAEFLKEKRVIVDAGCGLGYKAAWMANLSPDSLVIGIDYSESARHAAENYAHIKNLVFIRADIAETPLEESSVDYVSCDQVIMHTENPEKTFSHLSEITSKTCGEFACYFYAKKALPRELLDDHFRSKCMSLTNDELWTLSEQLTQLGKTLSDLNLTINIPDIPTLGIKGGEQDLQRFIYWNFIKCFWNEELGVETSIVTNFDWYSPSNARRFEKQEVFSLAKANSMLIKYFHEEEACYSARFTHRQSIQIHP